MKNTKRFANVLVYVEKVTFLSSTEINMETGEEVYWEAPITHFPQEPIFVPRPAAIEEDDGILLIGGFNYETAKAIEI